MFLSKKRKIYIVIIPPNSGNNKGEDMSTSKIHREIEQNYTYDPKRFPTRFGFDNEESEGFTSATIKAKGFGIYTSENTDKKNFELEPLFYEVDMQEDKHTLTDEKNMGLSMIELILDGENFVPKTNGHIHRACHKNFSDIKNPRYNIILLNEHNYKPDISDQEKKRINHQKIHALSIAMKNYLNSPKINSPLNNSEIRKMFANKILPHLLGYQMNGKEWVRDKELYIPGFTGIISYQTPLK
ncbi:hypothetical protein C0585_04660 [Candidatus Woesearchaeota archaeon]|nr:MAG: hypothetical protein C0585_04660 [Candidatus Woesearchaeota archaeon]